MNANKLEFQHDPRLPNSTYAYNHDEITGKFGLPCSFILYRQCANWGECGGVLLGVRQATSPSSAGAVSHGMCEKCRAIVEAQLRELVAAP